MHDDAPHELLLYSLLITFSIHMYIFFLFVFIIYILFVSFLFFGIKLMMSQLMIFMRFTIQTVEHFLNKNTKENLFVVNVIANNKYFRRLFIRRKEKMHNASQSHSVFSYIFCLYIFHSNFSTRKIEGRRRCHLFSFFSIFLRLFFFCFVWYCV